MDNYLDINRSVWNQRTDIHIDSNFYDNEAFIAGKSSLNSIELDLLGDLKGKRVLHLQCHFGQDSISLSRLGAKVTGLDLSDKAITRARELAEKTQQNVEFVCSDVYSAKDKVEGQFDIVFSSYGTIGWLPDIDRWADIVAHFLKPRGQFVFAEFHPVVWMHNDELKKVAYSYFNDGPIVIESEGTYANQEADIKVQSVGWNHSLGGVLSALLNQGLNIRHFNEYNYSPYGFLEALEESEPGKYTVKGLGKKFPLVYSIVAEK